MANPFDQFDTPVAQVAGGNPFDQFDTTRQDLQASGVVKPQQMPDLTAYELSRLPENPAEFAQTLRQPNTLRTVRIDDRVCSARCLIPVAVDACVKSCAARIRVANGIGAVTVITSIDVGRNRQAVLSQAGDHALCDRADKVFFRISVPGAAYIMAAVRADSVSPCYKFIYAHYFTSPNPELVGLLIAVHRLIAIAMLVAGLDSALQIRFHSCGQLESPV